MPGETHGGRLRGCLSRRDERVEPGQQAVALRTAGRIAQALGREERRDGERLRVAEREIRERGQAGLESVDDVEAAKRQRKRKVRPRADRHADSAPARDRHRGPHHDDLGLESVEEGAPSRREIARPVRGGQNRHRVPELP